MAPPGDLDALSPTELRALVVRLLGKVAALEQTVAAQRAETERDGEGQRAEAAQPSQGPPRPGDAARRRRRPGHRGHGAARLAVQGLCRFPRSGSGAAGPLHPLSPGALAHTGRAADRGAAAGRDRWPFRARAAPLRPGPVPSRAGQRAAPGGAIAGHRPGHLQAASQEHLAPLGSADLTVTPDPVSIATEVALWGAIKANGLLPDTVIVSDD